MIRTPSIEQAERIALIVQEVTVTFKPEQFDWEGHKVEAYTLLTALGHKTPNKSCFSCWVNALNKLRVSIKLDPIGHPDVERGERRMTICKACPAFRNGIIKSCGRYILDAITPIPVSADGQMIEPCGCDLNLKTPLKWAKCPASKW